MASLAVTIKTEPSLPCCKECGAPAVLWIRLFIDTPPLQDDRGRWWSNSRPGGLEGFCREHRPLPPPMELGLLC